MILHLILHYGKGLKVITNCIEWKGYTRKDGYGQTSNRGKRGRYAHRVAYEDVNGKIPNGMVIDHLCRNRICVNPNHMEIVTLEENNHRGNGIPAKNGRKKFCLREHEFTTDNTFSRLNGKGRECKACKRVRYINAKY